MVERILSKAQGRVFVALARQKQEIQETYQEIVDAEVEQVELLLERYGLPEGTYHIRQERDGRLVLFLEQGVDVVDAVDVVDKMDGEERE